MSAGRPPPPPNPGGRTKASAPPRIGGRGGADGLIPAVVQDAESGAVLMVAFMNEEALEATRRTGRVHFWSRSRQTLWRKGETSGHEQIVDEIHVNCELNSVLVTVKQIGAVCHEGYPTCFYRRLEADGTLTIVRERVFDPATVYGVPDALAAATRQLFGAYAYLRDNDLTAVSGTSARLHDRESDLRPRLADELRELAGVLDGTHRHADPRGDVLLEATQVLYWVTLIALRAGADWDSVRPDRALMTGSDELSPAVAAKLLRANADEWQAETVSGDIAARCHATFALVAQACQAANIPTREVVEADLAALREKTYLASYFAATGAAALGKST